MVTRRLFLAAAVAQCAITAEYPTRKARVEALWKSPDGNPNALEATAEGLWVGEQVTDAACLLDWQTGKVVRKVATESSNTSGIAYGGGFLWMAANGPASRRPPRPTDTTTGEVHKVSPKTGKTVARYPVPGGGGVHGLCWAENSLWVTTLAIGRLTRYDVEFKEISHIPITLDRAHGLAWDGESIWCMFSNEYMIQRLDPRNGKILEVIQLNKGTDPDPHGLTMHDGMLYYSDSGFVRGGGAHPGKYGGYVCRVHLS
ncbi:MAG: hypothetical protein O2968_06195 [Acidobacteria bacterium]|nr:hypothetical protein [Acidobacteriota bacterium]